MKQELGMRAQVIVKKKEEKVESASDEDADEAELICKRMSLFICVIFFWKPFVLIFINLWFKIR